MQRRRSSWWVREFSSLALHRLGGKLLNKFRSDGLSPKESNLYDQVLSELAYRRRAQRVPADQCSCMFCCGPFDDSELNPEGEAELLE